MSFLKDLLPIFKKYNLRFVEKRTEAKDAATFIFEAESSISWKAGQHGLFSVSIPSTKGKQSKPFSIASIPEEGKIIVSTRIPESPSQYKQGLLNLKPGDIVSMRGPIGPFYVEDRTKPRLFVAGGIGITPFRALLLDLVKNGGSAKAELLYIDSGEDFVYREELDAIAAQSKFITIKYMSDRERLSQGIHDFTSKYGNDGYYFVSGSVSMVKAIKEKLKEQGIKGKNIKSDAFFGMN